MNFRSVLNLLKKFKSVIILSVVVIAIVIPIVVTTITASQYPLLFSVGSSAVKPILEGFANKYASNVNNNFDLIIDAGGSSTGIESIAYGYTQIGNTSRNPKKNEVGKDGRYNNEWKKGKLKTVTLAWDGIAIVYKKPKDITTELNISNENIWKLYEAMTGCYSGEDMTLNDLTSGLGNHKIIAYPRSGGSAKSGTADAFANDSHLINNTTYNPTNKDEIQNALKNGQYNFNRNINVTNESNAETWLRVLNDNLIGSITYLSTGFVLNNLDDIKKNGFDIALYNNNTLKFETIANGYGWVRPINSIISLEDKNINPFIEFLYWLFESSANIEIPNSCKNYKYYMSENDFKEIGVKPLTINQIKSMTIKENSNWNFIVSDLQKNGMKFSDKMIFGAVL